MKKTVRKENTKSIKTIIALEAKLLAAKKKNEDTRLLEAKLKEIELQLDERIKELERQIRELKGLFYNEKYFDKAVAFISKPLSQISVCITDLEGRLRFINEQFTKQTGYSKEDVLGKKPGPILQRDNTRQPAIDEIRQALRDRTYFEGEIVNYDKAGNEITCKLIIAPAKGESGNPENFISLAVFSKVDPSVHARKKS